MVRRFVLANAALASLVLFPCVLLSACSDSDSTSIPEADAASDSALPDSSQPAPDGSLPDSSQPQEDSSAIDAPSADAPSEPDSSSSDAAPPDANDASPEDAAPVDAPTADAPEPVDAGARRAAIIVSVIPPSVSDHVSVLTVGEDGVLTDTGLHVNTSLPQEVELRADGQEVLFVTGFGPGENKNMHALNLAPDYSSLTETDSVVVGTDNTVNDLLYTSADEAILAMRGAAPSYLVTVKRTGGHWTVGPEVPCGQGPLALYALAQDGHALMVRTDMLAPSTDSQALPIGRRADGGWAVEAAGVTFTEEILALAVPKNGLRAYVSASGPSDGSTLIGPGKILTLVPGSAPSFAWSQLPQALDTDRRGSLLQLSPDDRTLVIFAPATIDDPYTGEHVSGTELITIDVTPSGELSIAQGERTRLTQAATQVYGFTPAGHLILDVGGMEPECPQGHGLQAFSRDGAKWLPIGEKLCLDGMPTSMAIGPMSSK